MPTHRLDNFSWGNFLHLTIFLSLTHAVRLLWYSMPPWTWLLWQNARLYNIQYTPKHHHHHHHQQQCGSPDRDSLQCLFLVPIVSPTSNYEPQCPANYYCNYHYHYHYYPNYRITSFNYKPQCPANCHHSHLLYCQISQAPPDQRPIYFWDRSSTPTPFPSQNWWVGNIVLGIMSCF